MSWVLRLLELSEALAELSALDGELLVLLPDDLHLERAVLVAGEGAGGDPPARLGHLGQPCVFGEQPRVLRDERREVWVLRLAHELLPNTSAVRVALMLKPQ